MTEQEIYGLSEGVLRACKFLGLKLPPAATNKGKGEHYPSDYFGEDFKLSLNATEKLQRTGKLSKAAFTKIYRAFSKKFFSQKPLEKNETNLNIYFCDYLLTSRKKGASAADYFDLEFYRKSEKMRATFRTQNHRMADTRLCNARELINLLDDKAKTNKIFADFVHRDWLNTKTCTFEEFKNFADKHTRFFSKLVGGYEGKGAEIIDVGSNENPEKLFARLKKEGRLLEELIHQHESLAAFCSDTVNTIRVNTFLDVHNVAHILTTSGRFGRMGSVVDNFHGGGFSVIIDPKTGVITSDGLSQFHERIERHPDTGKTFKGFQYPFWEKLRKTVSEMAQVVPQLRHIGWDITFDSKNNVELVEANGRPDIDIQQAPDDTGRLYIYEPFMEELKKYKTAEINFIGYRVNNLSDFREYYDSVPSRKSDRLKFAVSKIIPDCKSLIDVGCRKYKFIQSVCPENIKCFSVDFENYGDNEIIVCDFNDGDFPDLKADVCFSAFTAEYVKNLPQFLTNMCNAAQKQILMWSRPVDKDTAKRYRWDSPFMIDFTEKFLIETIQKNNFNLHAIEFASDNKSVILYDFRRV